MKLSDIMSHAGLSVYAQIALVLFVVVFVSVIIRTFAPSRNRELMEAALLPLDDVAANRARMRSASK